MDRGSRREGAWDQAEKEDGAEKQKQQREGKTHGANGAFKLGAQKSKQMQTHPSIGENSNTLVTAGSLGVLEPSERNSVSNTSHPPSSRSLS